MEIYIVYAATFCEQKVAGGAENLCAAEEGRVGTYVGSRPDQVQAAE